MNNNDFLQKKNFSGKGDWTGFSVMVIRQIAWEDYFHLHCLSAVQTQNQWKGKVMNKKYLLFDD